MVVEVLVSKRMTVECFIIETSYEQLPRIVYLDRHFIALSNIYRANGPEESRPDQAVWLGFYLSKRLITAAAYKT